MIGAIEAPDQAYSAWYKSVESKYQFHTNKIDLSKHPKYIKNKIENLSEDQFGYSGFGLKMNKKNYIKNF